MCFVGKNWFSAPGLYSRRRGADFSAPLTTGSAAAPYAAWAAILWSVELETTAVPTRGVPSTTFESAFNTWG
jgi:hypothetical protein